jgi:hypothetical protein
MDITFKFELNQMVVTPLGDIGIISMIGYDDGGIQYYVKSSTNSSWFREDQLSISN